MKAAARVATMNTGEFRGRFYRQVRISKPHEKVAVWWVLDDGNHFKSLDALVRHVLATAAADRRQGSKK